MLVEDFVGEVYLRRLGENVLDDLFYRAGYNKEKATTVQEKLLWEKIEKLLSRYDGHGIGKDKSHSIDLDELEPETRNAVEMMIREHLSLIKRVRV